MSFVLACVALRARGCWAHIVRHGCLWPGAGKAQSGGARGEPVCQRCVAAFAGKVCSCLALVVGTLKVGAICQQQLGEVLAIGRSGGKDGRKAAGLGGIRVDARLEQKLDGFDLPAERKPGVERLIALRVAGDGRCRCAATQQCGHAGSSTEGHGQMQRGPAVTGVREGRGRICGKQCGQARFVAGGGSLKDVERDGLFGKGRAQKIADYRLAGLD